MPHSRSLQVFTLLQILLASTDLASATKVSCTANTNTAQNDAPLSLDSIYNNLPLGPVLSFNTTYRLNDALAAAGSSVTVEDNPLVMVSESSPYGPWPTFAVFACDSSYMGYPAATTGANGLPLQYGHIVYVNSTCGVSCPSAELTCVELTTVKDGKSHLHFLTQQPCATKDNKSQVRQFFQFATIKQGYEEFLMNVSFVGEPASSTKTAPVYYFVPGTDAAPAVEVTTEVVDYQLQFQYIHEN